MGNRNAKTLAVVLIVLLFGYYQRGVLLLFYELISTDDDRSIQSHPVLLLGNSGQDHVGSGVKPDIMLVNERGNDVSNVFKIVDDGESPNTYFDKESQSEVLSAVVQYRLNVLQSYSCQPTTLSCGAPMDFHETLRGSQKLASLASVRHCRKVIIVGVGYYADIGQRHSAFSEKYIIDCGLGCQVHHLMTCLMISFSLNATLVPDFSYWPYSLKWNDIFEPINPLNCQIDNATVSIVWSKNEIGVSHGGVVKYRLKVGLPITRDFSRKLKSTFSNPFLWWAGQFANFTVHLQPSQDKWITKTKQILQLSSTPVAGILLRRRDKKGEKRKAFHSIDKHLAATKTFFEDLETPDHSINETRRVYIATDDMSVLRLARKRYRPPKWEILGAQRKSEAEDIIKDIYLLAACDFVVCNFSSDICRLVVELMDSRNLNGAQKVKSLNTKYSYQGKEMNKLKFIFPY